MQPIIQLNTETNKTIPKFVNGVVGQVILSLFCFKKRDHKDQNRKLP